MPPDYVVTPHSSHTTPDVSRRSPYEDSAAPTASCPAGAPGDRLPHWHAATVRSPSLATMRRPPWDSWAPPTRLSRASSPASSPSAFRSATRPAAARGGPDAPRAWRAGAPGRAHPLAPPRPHLPSGLHGPAACCLALPHAAAGRGPRSPVGPPWWAQSAPGGAPRPSSRPWPSRAESGPWGRRAWWPLWRGVPCLARSLAWPMPRTAEA